MASHYAEKLRSARLYFTVRRRRTITRLGALLGLGLAALVSVNATEAAEAPVGLGTAASFAVLAGAGVSNTGPTVITGDLGTCPTPAVTGFPPGSVSGTVHANDAVACNAKSDLTIAYNDAAGRPAGTTFPGATDLGGMTLTPGVYGTREFAGHHRDAHARRPG